MATRESFESSDWKDVVPEAAVGSRSSISRGRSSLRGRRFNGCVRWDALSGRGGGGIGCISINLRLDIALFVKEILEEADDTLEYASDRSEAGDSVENTDDAVDVAEDFPEDANSREPSADRC